MCSDASFMGAATSPLTPQPPDGYDGRSGGIISSRQLGYLFFQLKLVPCQLAGRKFQLKKFYSSRQEESFN
jgi:hypothetical protein